VLRVQPDTRNTRDRWNLAYAGDHAVTRYCCRGGSWKSKIHASDLAAGPRRQSTCAQLVCPIGLAHGVVPSVLIIGEGLITDAEGAAQNEFVSKAIGQSETRSNIMVERIETLVQL